MIDVDSSPFNQEFCIYLEYYLCTMFKHHSQKGLRWFWCDGVSCDIGESQLSPKSINDNRRLVTTAWIGKDGQDKYEMTILFGKYSLRKYAKGSSLIDCIPAIEPLDWVEIDTKNKIIEIRLN